MAYREQVLVFSGDEFEQPCKTRIGRCQSATPVSRACRSTGRRGLSRP
jgi:hypothetical protein